MITNSSEKAASFSASKQEGGDRGGGSKKLASTSTSSRQWSSAGFRNPRIVRVSRTFGGKDRHSKVCTIRGLRDRRIRLSVPTAVQLYDLQDRLGLSQPSKVIDWLIEATEGDIDKLPPLQIPQGSLLLSQFHHHQLETTNFPTTFETKDHHHHHHQNHNQDGVNQLFAQKFFPLSSNNLNHSTSLQNGMSFEPSNSNLFSLSHHHHHHHHQFGTSSHGFSIPQMDSSNANPSSFSSSLLPGSQLFFYPPNSTPSFYTPYPPPIYNNIATTTSSTTPVLGHDHQNQNHSSTSTSTSTSSSQHVFSYNSLMPSLHSSSANNASFKSFPTIFNPKFLSQSSFQNRPEKDHI